MKYPKTHIYEAAHKTILLSEVFGEEMQTIYDCADGDGRLTKTKKAAKQRGDLEAALELLALKAYLLDCEVKDLFL